MSSEIAKPTLYDRLGGVYSIAAVVDDFIDRVMHNPVLNANAAVDEAHHRTNQFMRKGQTPVQIKGQGHALQGVARVRIGKAI